MLRYIAVPLSAKLVLMLALAGDLACAGDVANIKQTWSSSGTAYAETDSLAACRLPDGTVRVYATAKEGNRIDVFDAATGQCTGHYGSSAAGPTQLAYPNGIAAVTFSGTGKPIILVVERDGHRVHAFTADTLAPLGTFGEAQLHRPYGISVGQQEGAVQVYVTDTEVPPAETVKVFNVRLDGEAKIAAAWQRSFGAATGKGRVRAAESIVVDDRYRRVLVCDEDKASRDVKVYNLDGTFADQTFGHDFITREPEGVVVLDQPGNGLIIQTDQQKKLSVWHIFDRQSLKHLAAFTGEPTIANTDGICVFAEPFGPFKTGAFFAVNDDHEVRAYPLDAITALVAPATKP